MPIFAGLVIGVRVQPHRAQHVAALAIEGNERDRPCVVELRQPCEEDVVEIADRRKKTQAQILGRDAIEEFEKLPFVIRPDRTNECRVGRCAA